ncbi:MAG TPA: nucleotide exchange factor GrpE [Candidatus Gracilibacteria bacterium]|nr:nucleotide exchange factor GrpE [Candidatus Gracilibacteria bacterium]
MADDTTNPANQDAASGGDQTPLSSDQDLNQLQQELEQSQTRLQEMTNISQRALADLQNYKRRAEEEKAGFVTFANAALFSELLPAIQNIDRALTHEPKDAEWIKGTEQSMKQLQQITEKMGLKPIPTIGEKFNPLMHEALLTAPGEKDKILEELEKGYMLGERVLKPARVKVGNGE